MSASLVGSEMCIRDRATTGPQAWTLFVGARPRWNEHRMHVRKRAARQTQRIPAQEMRMRNTPTCAGKREQHVVRHRSASTNALMADA
eukprot:15390306-Alexandrium_andersonii.AAC.1